MTPEDFALAASVINSSSYIAQAQQAHNQRDKLWRDLLSHRRIPQKPWPEQDIEWVLGEVAKMDSNNFQGNTGLGEREARIASPLVARRHYRLGHGIGRSGDIGEVQPKAAGSSLVQKLTNYMVLDAIRISGATKQAAAACLVLPMATGMSLVLALQTLKKRRGTDAKYVIWPRMDQKSCLKAILTAGLVPLVVPNVVEGDQVRTDLAGITRAIVEHGASSIVCVFTTTSCFAPRVPDSLVAISLMCAEHSIPHLINNAYGLASPKCMNAISEAARQGRVDLYVQSTDKNFLVPVGGAVVAGPDKGLVEEVGRMYPGRASMSPILDVFITLLTLGADGYRVLLKERKDMYAHLRQRLDEVATRLGTRVLNTPLNDISIALSLEPFDKPQVDLASTEEAVQRSDAKQETEPKVGETDELPAPSKRKGRKPITFLGSMLFSRFVSGTRVVPVHTTKTIADHTFDGYMSHVDEYVPHGATGAVPYLTAAAAIGVTMEEIDVFAERLERTVREFLEKERR